MSKTEAKKRIVNLVRLQSERAFEAYRSAHATRVWLDASANAWDEFNKDNGVGGFSQNPHNTIQATKNEEAARLNAAHWKEAYDLAVDTFLSDPSDDESLGMDTS